MRDIKVRVWAINVRKWLKINLFSNWGNVISPFGISRETVIIQQFTGLLDKNGREIYEGDIIKSPIKMFGIEENLPLIVKFDKGAFEAFFPEPEDGLAFPMVLNSALFNCEIIGNIYENPELLNENV